MNEGNVFAFASIWRPAEPTIPMAGAGVWTPLLCKLAPRLAAPSVGPDRNSIFNLHPKSAQLLIGLTITL